MEELHKSLLERLRRLQRLYLDTCSRCNLCALKCPTYEASQDVRVTPGYRMRLVRDLTKRFSFSKLLGLERRVSSEELLVSTYNCTLCGRCEEHCPYGIDTTSLWLSLREAVRSSGLLPSSLKELEETILRLKNPYGVEPYMKTYWPEMVGLEEVVRKAMGRRASVVLFMGCTPSIRSVGQDILASAVRLLEKARESWALLSEEWCCGCPLLMLGNREAAAIFARHNVEAVESLAPNFLVTVCPTCHKMFKFEYETLLGRPARFKAVHITELLLKYIVEFRLEVPSKLDVSVAYHDPCDLARASGVTEAPRMLIKEVARELVELPEGRLDTSCCGGGGLLQAVNNELRLEVAKRRLREAVEADADVLASACPACKAAFIEAAREEGLGVEVLDVVEIVARALGLA
ncbi:MAG: (Fe-S)-binding protein [Candidatus Nezhaarchaeota archaeon]|nr:(Fe-S)-binding protein [Candidatus Nezhaarchaeota archaeon]